MYTMLISNSLV